MKNENIKKITFILLFVLLFNLLVSSISAAYPSHEAYIYDGASVLSKEDAAKIKSTADALFSAKGVRLSVCIVENTGEEEADEYAKNLFNEWKVPNGVLLLVVTSTKYYHAVQSTSIDQILTNEKLSSILNTTLEPEFVAENYSAGIAATVTSLSDFLSENISEPLPVPDAEEKDTEEAVKEKSGIAKVFGVILRIIVIVALLLIIGYVILVILEKRQAKRRRMYLEERRRRMAQNGRGGYYSRPVQGRPASRPAQNNSPDLFTYPENGAYYSNQSLYGGQHNNQPGTAPGNRKNADYYRDDPYGIRYDDSSATREFTRRR